MSIYNQICTSGLCILPAKMKIIFYIQVEMSYDTVTFTNCEIYAFSGHFLEDSLPDFNMSYTEYKVFR